MCGGTIFYYNHFKVIFGRFAISVIRPPVNECSTVYVNYIEAHTFFTRIHIPHRQRTYNVHVRLGIVYLSVMCKIVTVYVCVLRSLQTFTLLYTLFANIFREYTWFSCLLWKSNTRTHTNACSHTRSLTMSFHQKRISIFCRFFFCFCFCSIFLLADIVVSLQTPKKGILCLLSLYILVTSLRLSNTQISVAYFHFCCIFSDSIFSLF